MINIQLHHVRRIFTSAVFFIGLSVYGPANASWLVDNDVALGIEGGNYNSGLSMKLPYSADSSWQITLGGGGGANGIGGRYLSYYSETNDWRLYWYGGLSIRSWGGNYRHSSETFLGINAGVGADFDLSRLENIPLPLIISFTAGPSYAAFSNFRGFDFLGIGMGFHYRFK